MKDDKSISSQILTGSATGPLDGGQGVIVRGIMPCRPRIDYHQPMRGRPDVSDEFVRLLIAVRGRKPGRVQSAPAIHAWEHHVAVMTWAYGVDGALERLSGLHRGTVADVEAWGRLGRERAASAGGDDGGR